MNIVSPFDALSKGKLSKFPAPVAMCRAEGFDYRNALVPDGAADKLIPQKKTENQAYTMAPPRRAYFSSGSNKLDARHNCLERGPGRLKRAAFDVTKQPCRIDLGQ
jgi:hypothetical protein